MFQRAVIPVLAVTDFIENQGAELQSRPNAQPQHISFVRTLIENEKEPEHWPGDSWADEPENVEPSDSLACPT